MIYKMYGKLHQAVKKILKKSTPQLTYRMVSVTDNDFVSGKIDCEGEYFNEVESGRAIEKKQAYPVENIVPIGSFPQLMDSFCNFKRFPGVKLGVKPEEAEGKWKKFIESSRIRAGFKNGGLHYAGYIMEYQSWCLPSWIWTNAAIIRMYCMIGEIEQAKTLSDILISIQQECGGWIVRNDYDCNGPIPVLAPNDSAYVANNGCLQVFFKTKEKKYLDAAEKCGQWIINTARNDGMVYVSYDNRAKRWQTDYNIIDIGFTAGLFANLYQATGKECYKTFLKIFTSKYIELFYNPSLKGFATSLDENDQQLGGMFGRGQAWALEGLIPAYQILKDERVKYVIDNTVETLLRLQDKRGGWAYNLSRPLMGIDCKATSIIALALINWSTEKKVVSSAIRALTWIINHTSSEGISEGGIFSYTTEGAIVHHMYTSTAFVYSSAYAVELKRKVDSFDLH